MNLKNINECYNPFYHWWKVRKEFKRPHAHLHTGKIIRLYGMPIRDEFYNKFLDIKFSSLGWKDKYNHPEHEWDPYISIIFFNKFQLLWTFNWTKKNNANSYTRSMATWEAILDRLYFHKSLEECIEDNIWGTVKDEKITIEENIKRK